MKKQYFKQLAQETLVYGISGMISKFIMIFLVPIYTRIFLPEDFGIISIVNTTMVLINLFIVMGLDSAAHRWYWDQEDENYRKKTISTWFWFQFLCSIIFCLLLFVYSKKLSIILFKKEENFIYFNIIAFYFPLSITNTIIINLFRMQRKPWFCFWYTLIFSILNIASSIILVLYLRLGIEGVFYAQIITAFLNTVFSFFILKDWIHLHHFSSNFLKSMLKYSIPLIPASLSYWIVNLSGNYFINFLTDTKQVGLYQVGNTIASAIGLITGAFQQAIGPFSLSIFKESDSKKIYADILMVYLTIVCIICVMFNLFSYEILIFFTNKNYEEAYKVIPFITFTHIVISISYIAMIGVTISKTTKPYAEGVMLSTPLSILLYLVFIPKIGIIGAGLSSLISQLFITIYIFIKSQRIYKISYQFNNASFVFAISLLVSLISQSVRLKDFANVFLIKIFIFLFFSIGIYMNKAIRDNLKHVAKFILFKIHKKIYLF